MPKNKDLKRLVRARMQKSGESYTAARRQVLAKKTRSAGRQPSGAVSTAVAATPTTARAGMSDAAVRAKTGRTWRQWVATLDADGAALLPHREIARLLASKYDVPPWWSQMVTVGYERLKGLREVGQRRGGQRAGTYDANKSRTFPVPVAALYRACRDARARARWLPGVDVVVRKATPSRSLRLTWQDGTKLELMFFPKGRSKSTVQVQHHDLPTKAAADACKKAWHERLDALAAQLRGAE
jgi:uncharacterized protein YndB with AHSA1/START domain